MKSLSADRGFVRFAKSSIEMSIPDLFERQVRAFPRQTAVGCEQKSLTYDDLNRASNRIAHAILRRRGRTEEPIALLFRQGPRPVAATIGALKSRKICLPLEPNKPVRELQEIIAHSQPSLIIFDGETEALARRLMGDADRRLNIEAMTADESEIDPGLNLSPDGTCYIFYTSGTTGPPKGAYDNHRNVLHNIMRYTNSLEIGAKDRLSLIQSCSFSGTISSLFSALLNGAAVCPFDLQRQGIARLANWIEKEGITVFHSTPNILEQLMATGRKFDSLRMIRLEGDRAEPRQISLFQSHFDAKCALVNGLGLTEAGIVRQYFVTPKTKLDGDVVPVGHATEDMGIDLVDEKGRNIRQGGVGEIVIRSKYLACGYWRRPDLTKTAFLPDPGGGGVRLYRTGDLGRMGADGCLTYLGRKDFQVKLRGQWIDTAKIESTLCAIESINRALVLVRDSGSGAQQLVVYLVAEGTQPSIDRIRRVLSQILPAVMIPSRYVFMAAMPLDRNGKIDRRALPPPDRQRPDLEQVFIAPRSHEEVIIAECLGAILNIDRIGVYDDFLALGGDSLLATELLMLIEERLEVDGPVALIDQPLTVNSIARCCGEDRPESALVQLQAGNGRAPLFCIKSYGGSLLVYARLAACLGPERTIYGLHGRAFTKDGCREDRVENMAAAYLKEITAIEPDGPYYLCGNCFDGTIAFEMAQQLRQQGREVALLALIDTPFPGGFFCDLTSRILNLSRRIAKLSAKQWTSYLAQRLWSFTRRASMEVIRRPTSKTLWRLRGGHQLDSHRLCARERNKRAQAQYKPQQYEGEVVLICPGPPRSQRGWISLAAGGCHVIEVPVDDQSKESPHLIEDPYVGALAARMVEFLEA